MSTEPNEAPTTAIDSDALLAGLEELARQAEDVSKESRFPDHAQKWMKTSEKIRSAKLAIWWMKAQG